MTSTPKPFVILLVEDEPADAHLVRMALGEDRAVTDLHHVQDGIEALAFLRRKGKRFRDAPRPDLVLLDLYMPRMSGKEFLATIKNDAGLCDIPVVVLTISERQLDMPASYRLAAAGYITKPSDVAQFTAAIRKLHCYWSTLSRRTTAIEESNHAGARLPPEARLVECRTLFEPALAGADLILWDWHIAADRLTLSDSPAAMLGYQADEIGPDLAGWRQLVHNDDWPCLHQALDQYLQGEAAAFEVEARLRHKEGRLIWVLLRGKVVERDPDGGPSRAAGAILDITRGKESQDEVMQTVLKTRTSREAELRRALRDSHLVLHFQPQVSAAGHLIGAEALLRWQHPKRGLIFPSTFIDVAEKSGLILPIGHLVLVTACELLKAWENAAVTRDLVMAVNISASQFRQPDFVEVVREVLAMTGANQGRLRLELTEDAILENIDEAILKMAALKALGVKLALDDFGAGYSSLADFDLLPVGQLKIDRSFVARLGADPGGATIITAILALAEKIGIEAIAEGVEEKGQYDFLKQHGCKLFQGYLFGRPMPIEVFDRFRETSHRSVICT